MIAVRDGGEIGAQAHGDGAAEEFGQAADDDELGGAESVPFRISIWDREKGNISSWRLFGLTMIIRPSAQKAQSARPHSR